MIFSKSFISFKIFFLLQCFFLENFLSDFFLQIFHIYFIISPVFLFHSFIFKNVIIIKISNFQFFVQIFLLILRYRQKRRKFLAILVGIFLIGPFHLPMQRNKFWSSSLQQADYWATTWDNLCVNIPHGEFLTNSGQVRKLLGMILKMEIYEKQKKIIILKRKNFCEHLSFLIIGQIVFFWVLIKLLAIKVLNIAN